MNDAPNPTNPPTPAPNTPPANPAPNPSSFQPQSPPVPVVPPAPPPAAAPPPLDTSTFNPGAVAATPPPTPTPPPVPTSPPPPPPAPAPEPAPAPVSNVAPMADQPPVAPQPPADPVASILEPAADSEDDSESPAEQARGLFGALMFGIFNWLVVPAGIVLILHFFVFQAFHVVGYSMFPTLDQADYLIISKVDASLSRASKLVGKSGDYIPKRGSIIVFHYPKDVSLVFVKRTIGLPGDRVLVKNGKVTVFNKEHPQGFNPDADHAVADPITLGDVDEVVPPGNVFVMGDNRTPNGSFDSRDWGDLPSSDIIGQAVLRLLPLAKFKVL